MAMTRRDMTTMTSTDVEFDDNNAASSDVAARREVEAV
jgi:hypothetical protein